MKTRILATLFLVLALLFAPAIPVVQAQGQYPVQYASATSVAISTDAGQHYATVFLTSNITTLSFTSTSPQQSETVLVTFLQDGTGSRTVGLATNIKGTLTINSSASTVTVATFIYDVVSGDWFVTTVGHS